MTEQEKNARLYKQEVDRQLRSTFSPFIDQDFLIKVKDEILKDPRLKTIINKNRKIFANNLYNIVNGESIDYIIARNIAMIHWYWTIPYTNSSEDISKLYSDDDYIGILKNQVILQLRIRSDFDYFGEQYELVAYNPLNYTYRSLTFHLYKIYDDMVDKSSKYDFPNKKFKLDTLPIMLESIRSILILCETQAYGSAYALLRSLIQTFASYMAIGDNEDAAEAYNTFHMYSDRYTRSGRIPKEVYKIKPMVKRKNGKEYKNMNRFIDYGWLDKVGNTHTDYTMKNLFSYCEYLEPGMSNFLYTTYKNCNKFVHGSYSPQVFDYSTFMYILSQVNVILNYVAQDVMKITKKQIKCEGIDLMEEYKKVTINNKSIVDAYDNANKQNKSNDKK